MSTDLKHLFSSAKIGALKLKNRIVMPPMATNFAAEDGAVSTRLIDYYYERAAGGAGLVIVEVACVDRFTGKGLRNQICIDNDCYLDGLVRLSNCIKKGGASAAIQLHHAGIQSPTTLIQGQPVGPSAVERKGIRIPKQLDLDGIKDIINKYIDAAERAQRAGFDAVEIHGAHGYLPAQFLSPVWNERNDAYGGNLEKRVAFSAEIIAGIKGRLGNFPLIFRFNAVELGADFFNSDMIGQSLEEGIQLARFLEKAGADALHISAFGYGAHALHNMPDVPGALLPYAEAIKKNANIPVIAVGYLTPLVADEALKNGRCDFVSIGRWHITDPEMVTKIKQSRLGDIKPCIGCIKCLEVLNPSNTKGYQCSVNALAGRERAFNFVRTENTKRILVIGGGPAGMEVAYNAVNKGHIVRLVENNAYLGGQLNYAEKAPGKARISMFKEYLIRRLINSSVNLSLNTKGTPELIHAEKPDKVIIAIGASPLTPQINGIDKMVNIVFALDVFSGIVNLGQSVAIIGGELVGCEAADLISEDRTKQVTIMRRGKYLATGLSPLLRYALLAKLKQKGVSFMTEISYKQIVADGIVVLDRQNTEHLVKADTIVLAAGSKPNNELYESIKYIFDAQIIGDSLKPRSIREAIWEGFEAGMID